MAGNLWRFSSTIAGMKAIRNLKFQTHVLAFSFLWEKAAVNSTESDLRFQKEIYL